MKRVIDIPDEAIDALEQGCFGAKYNIYDLCGCVMNSTPLPEGAVILTKEDYSDLLLQASDERKRGTWVHGREIWREYIGDMIIGIGYENWRCSECGAIVKDEAAKVLWKYCPECGVKMEGT